MHIRSLSLLGCVSLSVASCKINEPTEASSTSPSAAPSGQRTLRNVSPAGASSKADWPFADRRSPDRQEDAHKKRFDIDALYKVRGLRSPKWSPDGKRILYTLASYDLPAGKSETDIYVVNGDGTDHRRLTQHDGPDSDPSWAPDGKSFLFVSARSGSPQVWIMPIDGGEPRQITKVSTGVDSPIWSPNGKWIAFSSQVFPEYGADDAANRALLEDIEKSTIRAHVEDELLYRHWTAYRDGRRNHVLLSEVATGKLTDLTPGDFDSPPLQVHAPGPPFVFSPDSSELCFVSNREPGSAVAWTTNKDLFLVRIPGGPPTNVTAGNKAQDVSPAYSPDGRFIAFSTQEKAGYEADRFRLALYDRLSGKTELMTESFDNWVEDFVWSPDSRSLVFRSPLEGRFPLFRLDTAANRIDRILGIPSVGAFDLSSDGRLTFVHSSVGVPDELFVAEPDGTGIRQLTTVNKEVVDQYDIRPAEEIWVDGAEGKKVQVFVVKPHGYVPGKKYPFILNVHGGPQMQWSDTFRGDWQVYPGAGYGVAFPNPHGSTGFGQAYTAAISKDWGGRVYADVMAVADALERQDYVDGQRMGAMGWSYGGYMMNWLLGHTDRFKAVASMMGIFNLASFHEETEELWFPDWELGAEGYQKWSPSEYASKFKTPTLIVSGEKDYRIPYTESLQLFSALRRRGVPARLVLFPDEGHWPRFVKAMPLYYAAHLDWFHKYLGGEASPYDPKQMARGRGFKKGGK